MLLDRPGSGMLVYSIFMTGYGYSVGSVAGNTDRLSSVFGTIRLPKQYMFLNTLPSGLIPFSVNPLLGAFPMTMARYLQDI